MKINGYIDFPMTLYVAVVEKNDNWRKPFLSCGLEVNLINDWGIKNHPLI